jgi:hypothetical protein
VVHLNSSPSIGDVPIQCAKTLETANLSIMECYSVMQDLHIKIRQGTENSLFFTVTEKMLNCLNPPLQKCAEDNSVNFYCSLYMYISKNFELSNAYPVHRHLPLNINL